MYELYFGPRLSLSLSLSLSPGIDFCTVKSLFSGILWLPLSLSLPLRETNFVRQRTNSRGERKQALKYCGARTGDISLAWLSVPFATTATVTSACLWLSFLPSAAYSGDSIQAKKSHDFLCCVAAAVLPSLPLFFLNTHTHHLFCLGEPLSLMLACVLHDITEKGEAPAPGAVLDVDVVAAADVVDALVVVQLEQQQQHVSLSFPRLSVLFSHEFVINDALVQREREQRVWRGKGGDGGEQQQRLQGTITWHLPNTELIAPSNCRRRGRD